MMMMGRFEYLNKQYLFSEYPLSMQFRSVSSIVLVVFRKVRRKRMIMRYASSATRLIIVLDEGGGFGKHKIDTLYCLIFHLSP